LNALPRRAFDHRADLLAALVYGCLAYLSFSALSDYANAHHLFPAPGGGWALAVAVDGSVLYAFISFKRAPWLAGILLVSGAATTYFLQRWHAQGALHPLVVAGVVPSLMVLVTVAWHRIKSYRPIPTPLGHPVPEPGQTPAPEEDRPMAPAPGPAHPDPQPDQVPERTRNGGARLTADQEAMVRAWVADGRRNKSEMARELDLNNRGRLAVGRLVDDLVRTNGHGGGP